MDNNNRKARRLVVSVLAVLASTQVFAGGAPVSAVPLVNDLALVGISLMLVGVAARLIGKRFKKP